MVSVCWGVPTSIDAAVRAFMARRLPLTVVPASDTALTVATVAVVTTDLAAGDDQRHLIPGIELRPAAGLGGGSWHSHFGGPVGAGVRAAVASVRTTRSARPLPLAASNIPLREDELMTGSGVLRRGRGASGERGGQPPEAGDPAEVGRARSGRARGIAAAVEGYFAAAWFGWGSSAAVPTVLGRLLLLGIGLAVVAVLLGVVLAVRSPSRSTPMRDRSVRRRYGILVGTELGVLGAGAGVLALTGLVSWIPVWVCAGVGLHFFPMSRVLGERSLVVLGALVVAVAGVALVAGVLSTAPPAAITGVGAGICLLVSAFYTLIDQRAYTAR